jgi:hypothetical protein
LAPAELCAPEIPTVIALLLACPATPLIDPLALAPLEEVIVPLRTSL